MSLRGIRYAIAIINSEIEFRDVDFIKEFDRSSETYYFVDNCTVNNKLELYLVKRYVTAAAEDYLYNILRYWVGLRCVDCDRILGVTARRNQNE